MPSPSGPGLTVVIPAYNEQNAITQTIEYVERVLLTLDRPCEILVVDDGSNDETRLRALAANARVIRHPVNAGYGRALLSGIEASSYETIAIVDADGTYPIDRLRDLVVMYDQGFDMVVGARQGLHYEPTFTKRALRKFFQLLAEFTTGMRIPDVNSGFRVFNRGPVLEYKASISSGFSFTTTVTLFFMLSNLFVGYLPIPYQERIGSSKVRLFSDTLRSLQVIMTAIARFNPLKLYLLLLIVNFTGNLVLISLSQFGPFALAITVVLAFGWNAAFVIMAIAILAIVCMKPSGNLSSSSTKRFEREENG